MGTFDIYEWNKQRYLNRIEESESYLEKLASDLSEKHPDLRFFVKFGERIDVRGSQEDLSNFGNKFDGQKFGEYEVFYTDDVDKGEIVSIIKSSEIQLNEEESKLCKRGQEYIKSRKRAGEKSSAYLSGRAVKVCKGQIEFKGKKQKDFKG